MYISYACSDYLLISYIHKRATDVLILSKQNEAHLHAREIGSFYNANQFRLNIKKK